jgi:hypothetical protein
VNNMANEEYPGAFAPGIDNEHWTYDSVPTISEEELMRRQEEARRIHNEAIEWEMNHVDSTWGEKTMYRRYHHIVPPPTPDQISKRPLMPPPEFPDDKDINNYTVDDVNPVYGLDTFNLKLLDTITARTSRVSAAITYVNDTNERLDLHKLIRMCPFIAKQLRSVLTETLTKEMKNDLEIINKLNEYIYSEEPQPEPEPETPDSGDTGGDSENTNEGGANNGDSTQTEPTGENTPTETPTTEGAEGETVPTEPSTENTDGTSDSEVPVTPSTDTETSESEPATP